MDGTHLASGLDIVIPGLRYISGYLEPAAHDVLMAAVDEGEWRDFGERRAQIYGYSYHYTKGGIYRVDDLPAWAQDLAARFERDGLMPELADQLVVNDYAPGRGIPAHQSLLITVAVTTFVWVTVTLLTQPTDRATLVRFYRLVRPGGPGWAPVAAEAGVGPSPDSLPQALLGWVLGCAFVYAAMFGTGSFLYGRVPQGMMWLAVFVVSGLGLLRVVPRLWAGSAAHASQS